MSTLKRPWRRKSDVVVLHGKDLEVEVASLPAGYVDVHELHARKALDILTADYGTDEQKQRWAAISLRVNRHSLELQRSVTDRERELEKMLNG